MDYLSIGFIIGSVLGLTGSGGALVAIPLFMTLGLDVKDASFLSLMAVILAGLLNLSQQYKKSDYKKASVMVGFSLLGSLALVPVKEVTPNIVIIVLLTLISLYSLFTIWRPHRKKATIEEEISFWHVSVVGFVLGGLTTLTGLGGGVLLMPIFVGVFRMAMSTALATSLLTIVGSSLISFLIQMSKGAHLPEALKILFLVIGMLVSTLILKEIVKRLTPAKTDLMRQIVFSGIVLFAMMKFYF